MSMIQIVLGAALGCIAAQGALFGLRQSIGWLQQGAGRARFGRLSSSPGMRTTNAGMQMLSG